jgi:hypothetical protein
MRFVARITVRLTSLGQASTLLALLALLALPVPLLLPLQWQVAMQSARPCFYRVQAMLC